MSFVLRFALNLITKSSTSITSIKRLISAVIVAMSTGLPPYCKAYQKPANTLETIAICLFSILLSRCVINNLFIVDKYTIHNNNSVVNTKMQNK